MRRDPAAALEQRLARAAAGQTAQAALDVLLDPALDAEAALLDRLLELWATDRLRPEVALAGIGAIAELRGLLRHLEAQARAGVDAAQRLHPPPAGAPGA